MSAYNLRRVRKGYQELRAAIDAKRIDALVVWHPDRLHRSPRELEDFITLVERTGCEIATVTADQRIDLTTPSGRMRARIVGAVAKHESQQKALRIKAKQRELAEAGKWKGGGRRPFGFEADHHAIREPEAALIRLAADRVLSGESTWSILRDWTAQGIPTVSGSPWNNRSLTQMLTSARVAGLRSHHGKIVAEAVWPAILDRETWERAGHADRALGAGRSTAQRISSPAWWSVALAASRCDPTE